MNHASELIAAQALSSLGMDASVLQESNVHRAIRRRMHAVELTKTEAYAEFYRASAEEQAALAEELYIHETFFFRDRGVFAELTRWCKRWFAQNGGTLQILSAPCSTGEEPYSLAATLHGLGIAPERYRIDSIDVSHAALARAGEATYSGMSLRNLPEGEREHVLSTVSRGWQVRPHLRESVELRQGNLLQLSAAEENAYDLILCRNLLLYLDSTARERLAANLLHWLRPGGRVVLGAADWSRDLEQYFRLEEPANSFAVRAASEPGVVVSADVDAAQDRTASIQTVVDLNVVEETSEEDPERLYELAIAAYGERLPETAERFCRKALYLEPAHLPSLELLSRLWKAHASPRLNHALAARLSRRRELASREAL